MAFALFAPTCLQAVELDWQPQRSNDAEANRHGSTISIRTTGNDPYLVWRIREPVGESQRVLEFDYFCVDGIDSVCGYLGPPISEASRFVMPDLSHAEGWQTYRVDLVDATGGPLKRNTSLLRIDPGNRTNVRIQIRDLRLRERTPQEEEQAAKAVQLRRQKLAADESIRHYLQTSFPCTIDRVHVGVEQITIEGDTLDIAKPTESMELVEFAPHVAISGGAIDAAESLPASTGRFRIEVPRYFGGRDRLHSAWRLRWKHDGAAEFVTARHFVTGIDLASQNVPASRMNPKSQKGLSAVSRRGPLDELPELGIQSITINLLLNRFLTTKPGGNRERIKVQGAEIYFNPQAFDHIDDLVDFARRHEIVVTAIVLIHRSKRAEDHSPLAHPQADGGVYAMPDVDSERGARLYAFVLDRIAERYRHPGRSPGGITNWIAHNEVDFHSVWTNMGRQPRHVLTETYYRSMRMIDLAARQHNPHARVFASLTHHWVVPDDGKWQQLSPQETIETLQRYSQIEGDFPWGVAYHPYPQSLFAATAWNDPDPQESFETPLITIQNLEVLGDFLDLPSMRDSSGKRRPVLLSEQGFHSHSYQPRDQTLQAASLLYAMEKVRKLPWVESFYYHRWIDHPDEGGLLLGLRTLPDSEHRYGQRKLSWQIYRAFGTEQEQEVVGSLR